MIKVLFVCHGNICRSTMAQYVMQDLVNRQGLADHFYINSAATSMEEIGNPVHRGTRAKLKEVGIPCGDHRAVQMQRSDYDKYDYLIGMEERNRRNMLRILGSDQEGKVSLLLDYAGSHGNIVDPWYTGDFTTTYSDIVRGCEGFLTFLEQEGKL